MMDKKYFIDQLKELSERLGMGLSEEILEKVIAFSRFKVFSKGEIIARE